MAETRNPTLRRAKGRAAGWLPLAAIGRLYRILRGRISFHGLEIPSRDPALTDRVVASLVLGTYESAEVRFIERFLCGHPGPLIELGSSLGITAGVAAQVMHPDARITCVEANPTLAARLRAGVPYLRRELGALVVVEAAVAERSGNVPFCLSEDTTASRIAADIESPLPSATPVEAISLPEIIEEQCPAGRFALLCDIEGAESVFLRGQQLEVLQRCDRLVIELHEGGGRDIPAGIDWMVSAITIGANMTILARYGNVVAAGRRKVLEADTP